MRLCSLLLLLPRSALGRKDVTIESFDPASHEWTSVSDPVMGGRSSGSFAVSDGVGVFEGEVRDVPFLSAPGFVSARTPRGGSAFPDVRSCDGLRLRVRSGAPAYEGFRLSFGTNFAGSMPYAHGYKARFDVAPPSGDGGDGDGFRDVALAFTDFSDNWDPKTGDIVISCADDERYCPDEATLQDMKQMEIMAEGVDGKIRLKIDSIAATNCDDDAVETDPNAVETNQNGGSSAGEPGQDTDNGGNTKTIVVEDFQNPTNTWTTLNDPVMGGQSYSNVEIDAVNGVAKFTGKCAIVPSLQAPGFITMQSGGRFTDRPARFPDVSTCSGFRFTLKTDEDYAGYRVSFGKAHAKGGRFAYGYKAPLPLDVLPPAGEFGAVVVPFEEFSDKWNDATGDIEVECRDDPSYCPSRQWLASMEAMSFWGEGVEGAVHLEVKLIEAVGCDADASDAAAAPSAIGSKIHTVASNPAYMFAFTAMAVLACVVGACMLLCCARQRNMKREQGYKEAMSAFTAEPIDPDFHGEEKEKDLELL